MKYRHKWGGAPLQCLICGAFYGMGTEDSCVKPKDKNDPTK